MLKCKDTILSDYHKLLLEALRQREQDVMRYIAFLVPALGGFVWLILSEVEDTFIFTVVASAILLLLLLGSMYSLALGYNFRSIVLELAKLGTKLEVNEYVLSGWPRSPEEFVNRYQIKWIQKTSKLIMKQIKFIKFKRESIQIPWCTPPEIINYFWRSFLVGILCVTYVSVRYVEKAPEFWILLLLGIFCFLLGFLYLPVRLGCKLRRNCQLEIGTWT